MSKPVPTAYTLQIISAEGLPLRGSRKPPKAFVKANLEGRKIYTKAPVRNIRPSWNESFEFIVRDVTSVLSLQVVHKSLFLWTTFICGVDIEVGRLVQLCVGGKDANLDLHAADFSSQGSIKVRFFPATQGCLVIADAQQAAQNVVWDAPLTVERFVDDASALISPPLPSGVFLPLLGVLDKLDMFVRLVDKAAKVHPYATLAWDVLSAVYKIVRTQVATDQSVVGLVDTMNGVYSFVDAIKAVPTKVPLLADVIQRIFMQTVECAIFIQEYTGQGFGGRVLRDTIMGGTAGKIAALSQNLLDLRTQFDTGVAIHIATVSFRTQEDVSTLLKNQALLQLEPADMDLSNRIACLPATRQDILRDIFTWMLHPSGRHNILWLYGVAGAGKSTIATTVAKYFADLGRLGAFLTFDRAFPQRSHPSKVFKTIAYQLALSDASIGTSIAQAVNKDMKVIHSSLSDQFDKLLVNPLSSIPSLPGEGPIVFVLDALDECGQPADRERLIAVLAEQTKSLPSNLRFIITSRAENDIREAFESRPHIESRELGLISNDNQLDIAAYFKFRLGEIRSKKKLLDLGGEWPGEQAIQKLTRRACGLFVWAATASDFIDAHNPVKRLELLLGEEGSVPGAESALDSLYRTALESAGDWSDEDFVADFRAIMGTIIVARIPMSTAAIDGLLVGVISQPSIVTILQLGCVLQHDPAVRVLHPSFLDFLATRERCGRDIWFFTHGPDNSRPTSQCFQRMNRGLKRNLCDLTLSAHLGDQSLPEELAYACQFWVDHLCASGKYEPLVVEKLDDFLCTHLLHWLEAMSILRKSSEVPGMLRRLSAWIAGNCPEYTSLEALVSDAMKFVHNFEHMIKEHPILVYFAALPFHSRDSVIYRTFHDPLVYPSITWSTGKSRRGHYSMITSVAFSADRCRIISGSVDRTIRVWDVATCSELMKIEGHEGWVNCVAFSRDGLQIISGSADQTVRIWNSESGSQIREPLRGHEGLVQAVAISADGSRVVSGSADKTVRIWDTASGKETVPSIRGHEGLVTAVAFSPDGTRIASCSWDKTIRIWDTSSGVETMPPIRVDGVVWSVEFSSDGIQIILKFENRVEARDSSTGQQQPLPLRGQSSSPIDFVPGGWIVDFHTQRTFSKIPVESQTAWMARDQSFAFGTNHGKICVIQFPLSTFEGQNTRAAGTEGTHTW